VKIGWRHGDRAPISLIELLPADGAGKAKAESSSSAKKKSRRAVQKEKGAAAQKKPSPRRSAKNTTA